jgi:hypothetical protein
VGKPARARQGNAMSTKQVARTVLDGKLITFRPFPAEPTFTVCGYVYGMDDYHWAVVESGGQTHLVHKAAPVVTMADESTFEQESSHESLEKLVGPFRSWVERELFSRGASNGTSELQDEKAVATC